MSIFQEDELVSEGVRLWWGRTLPGERVRAEVVFTHGLGEHGGRYEHVARKFAEAGVRVIVYDLRGHGRSGGPRGDAPRYEALLDDLRRVVERCARGEGPLFLLGHSLGGQITLNYLLRDGGHARGAEVRGAVIASPWLRLAFAPSRWRLLLARVWRRLWPRFSQRTPGDALRLSRDARHMASLSRLELVHHRISTRLFFWIQEAGAAALAAANRLETPLLLLHGGADEVTSPAATKQFFEEATRVDDKRLIIYPEALHETHNDLCRDEVIAEMAGWVSKRVAAAPLSAG